MPTQKAQCTKCKKTKPATSEYFRPRSAKNNGCTSWCLECLREKDRKRIRVRPKAKSRIRAAELAAKGLKRCSRCKNVKPFEEFSRRGKGHVSWCKDCVRTYAAEQQRRRRNDPVERKKLKEEKQRYRRSPKGRARKRVQSKTANHKRRQRHLQLPWRWTTKDWKKCQEAWDHCCAYCGNRAELTQDHFIPITAVNCPGTVPENMVPACMSCNCSKQHRSPEKWCSRVALRRIEAYFASLAV
jgi:hypothetical protein